jgi:hypothetical protein
MEIVPLDDDCPIERRLDFLDRPIGSHKLLHELPNAAGRPSVLLHEDQQLAQ